MSNQLKASHIQRFILTAANIRSNQVFIPDLPTLQVLMCESAYFLGWWIIRLQLKVRYVCLRLPPVQMFDSFGTLFHRSFYDQLTFPTFLGFPRGPFMPVYLSRCHPGASITGQQITSGDLLVSLAAVGTYRTFIEFPTIARPPDFCRKSREEKKKNTTWRFCSEQIFHKMKKWSSVWSLRFEKEHISKETLCVFLYKLPKTLVC